MRPKVRKCDEIQTKSEEMWRNPDPDEKAGGNEIFKELKADVVRALERDTSNKLLIPCETVWSCAPRRCITISNPKITLAPLHISSNPQRRCPESHGWTLSPLRAHLTNLAFITWWTLLTRYHRCQSVKGLFSLCSCWQWGGLEASCRPSVSQLAARYLELLLRAVCVVSTAASISHSAPFKLVLMTEALECR
jgi:hypothetical protein